MKLFTTSIQMVTCSFIRITVVDIPFSWQSGDIFHKAVKAVSDNRGIGDQKVKGRLDTDWGGFQAKLAANAIHKGHSSTHFY